MFSIITKCQRNSNDIEFVKLTMVFYKTGHNRVYKVLYITGAYSDWQKDKQCFTPNSADNISKNSLLQKEKLKYLRIAEKWEYAGKNWTPIELAHYFDKKNEVLDKYTSVSEIIKQIEKETAEQTRIRNGREFDNRRNARTFQYLHNCLERFTLSKYRKTFLNYLFRDITEKFIEDFIIYSKREGAKNGNRGGVFYKLHMLYKIVEYAQKKKLYNVNLGAFDKFKIYMKESPVVTKAVSHEIIMKIEQVDRSILKKCEHLYLDLFLFSYYAGGMSGIDICYLERHMINGDSLKYERIKTDKICRVILTEKALALIEKYKPLAYMNYLFPIFKLKNTSQHKMYTRVNYTTRMVAETLRKICAELGINHHIAWSTARSSFICKMLDEGYHVYQVAEMTGNSPMAIYKHYYGITDKEKISLMMNNMF
ncbi:integrase [Alistipes sp.]|uniref:integrase n=1 Tax=Alistipes sp. TaxID=1872444 RepID=UPI003AB2D57B